MARPDLSSTSVTHQGRRSDTQHLYFYSGCPEQTGCSPSTDTMSHSSVLLTVLRTMSLCLWCLQQWAVNTWRFVITLKNLLIKFTRLCPLERPWNHENVPFWLCSSQSLPGKWPLEWKKFLLLSNLDPQSHPLLPENCLLQLCTPEWRKCYKGSLGGLWLHLGSK